MLLVNMLSALVYKRVELNFDICNVEDMGAVICHALTMESKFIVSQ